MTPSTSLVSLSSGTRSFKCARLPRQMAQIIHVPLPRFPPIKVEIFVEDNPNPIKIVVFSNRLSSQPSSRLPLQGARVKFTPGVGVDSFTNFFAIGVNLLLENELLIFTQTHLTQPNTLFAQSKESELESELQNSGCCTIVLLSNQCYRVEAKPMAESRMGHVHDGPRPPNEGIRNSSHSGLFHASYVSRMPLQKEAAAIPDQCSGTRQKGEKVNGRHFQGEIEPL